MSLSAGQKQRILLARALYRRPDVLVLDEGTANLDRSSELGIMALVKSLDVTRVVVGHRPETIDGASRIFHISSGSMELISGPMPRSTNNHSRGSPWASVVDRNRSTLGGGG